MKEISNGLTTMVQKEYQTAGALTAERLIAKNPSADLPEPSKFVKRCLLISNSFYARSFEHQLLVGH